MNIEHTWKIPWIIFVDVNMFDELKTNGFILHLPPEVKPHKFFISGMKAIPRKIVCIVLLTVITWITHHHLLHFHFFCLASSSWCFLILHYIYLRLQIKPSYSVKRVCLVKSRVIWLTNDKQNVSFDWGGEISSKGLS